MGSQFRFTWAFDPLDVSMVSPKERRYPEYGIVTLDLRNEIIRRVEALPLEAQRQLLAYVELFEQTRPRGEKGSALLPYAGVLDDGSAAEMSRAIESACEVVDSREW